MREREIARRIRRDEASCARCGCSYGPSLSLVTLCAECRNEIVGMAVRERHHVVGRAVPFTIEIPANAHQALSSLQYEWQGSPLPWLHAIVDIARYFLDRIELALEVLDDAHRRAQLSDRDAQTHRSA